MSTIDTYFGPGFWVDAYWPVGFWVDEEQVVLDHVFMEQTELCRDPETYPQVLTVSTPVGVRAPLPQAFRPDLPQPRRGRYLDYDI